MREGSLKPKMLFSVPIALFGVLAFFLLIVSAWIPSLGGKIYASPDETAAAATALQIASFHLPRLSEPLAVAYPWMHARSWVSHTGTLVPVGFLGWPLFLAPFASLFGSRVLPWLGWFAMLSAAYPLFYLLRSKFSSLASFAGVLVAYASPAAILYANRGLFPNVGLFASALWSVWALMEWRRTGKGIWLPAFFCALAFVIRPIELLWLLPWWIWASGWSLLCRVRERYISAAVFSFIVGSFFFANRLVYGHWWQIGYWLHDNALKSTGVVLHATSFGSLLPFGIHPRNILWNVTSFFGAFLWPSVVLFICAFLLRFRERDAPSFGRECGREWFKRHGVVLLALWMIFVLLVLYGSGIYQDHVQAGAITVANSFLRYLLPLAPLVGLAAASLFDRLVTDSRRRLYACGALLFIVAFGMYAALFKDDEGVVATRKELARYELVLERTEQLLPLGSVVLSERSDKIFFGRYRVVSPMPPASEVSRLIHDASFSLPVGLYVRPPSQAERDDWRAVGVGLIDLGVFGREHLYRLSPL